MLAAALADSSSVKPWDIDCWRAAATWESEYWVEPPVLPVVLVLLVLLVVLVVLVLLVVPVSVLPVLLVLFVLLVLLPVVLELPVFPVLDVELEVEEFEPVFVEDEPVELLEVFEVFEVFELVDPVLALPPPAPAPGVNRLAAPPGAV